MEDMQREYINKVHDHLGELSLLEGQYWKQFADYGNWQFWVNVALLVLPLIILLMAIDRRKIFQILFFGMIVHALMNYLDTMAVAKRVITHPYPLLPTFNINLSINTSVIPVVFMFAYQYSINKNKNAYLAGAAACIFTGLILGFTAKTIGFLEMSKWMNIWILVLVDYLEFLFAYWLTSFFIWLSKRSQSKPA